MDEKRRYFRVKNTGQIKAHHENGEMNILELSNSGAVIDNSIAIPRVGKFDLKINTYTTNIDYEVIRIEEQTIVLAFTNTEEKESLFAELKQLRDQKKIS